MITRSDDSPGLDPDDPVAVLLRPTSDHLLPPPGRFEEIRRGAARRRRLRAAATGLGVSFAAALIVLPLHLTTSPETTTPPTIPLAPPPTSGPVVTPAPEKTPGPVNPRPSEPATPAPGRTAEAKTDATSGSVRAPRTALEPPPRGPASTPRTAAPTPTPADAASRLPSRG
ncbi:hypothetical protein ACF09C_36975 [Streptomyces sp. NPDC014870]|uniref:hypothetical protein n=1 Tax=Streptomyces sp. NPDC014870 TaxID=3364925 RepID=UPI0036F9AC0D